VCTKLRIRHRGDLAHTHAADFGVKTVRWDDKENVIVKVCAQLPARPLPNSQLWDIAGQDSFSALTRVYYRGAHACLIVFDRQDPSPFEVGPRCISNRLTLAIGCSRAKKRSGSKGRTAKWIARALHAPCEQGNILLAP
jgi:hypothetical protein